MNMASRMKHVGSSMYFYRADGSVLFLFFLCFEGEEKGERERNGEGEGEEGRVRCEGKELATRHYRDVDGQEP